MQKPPAPFSCNYSPNVPELLTQLNCTIAISTYQAGKVVFISPNGPDELVQLPRNFTKAMGMAVSGDRLGVATKEEIVVLANSKGLAATYPTQPGVYDGLFVPRATYFSGEIDVHDMAWGNDGLYAVNTRFSCLALVDDAFSFTPIWQPDFITDLTPNDRCHLNGLNWAAAIGVETCTFADISLDVGACQYRRRHTFHAGKVGHIIINRFQLITVGILEHFIQAALRLARKDGDAEVLGLPNVGRQLGKHGHASTDVKTANADLHSSSPQRPSDIHRPRKLVRLHADQGHQTHAATFGDRSDNILGLNPRIRLVLGSNLDIYIVAKNISLNTIER